MRFLRVLFARSKPSKRTLLADTRHAQDELARQAEENHQDELNHMYRTISPLRDDLARIKPTVNVQLTNTQVDQIAERFSDQLVLPQWASDQIAEYCSHGSQHMQSPALYLGPYQIVAEWTGLPDGTLKLQLRDSVGTYFWQGRFSSAIPSGNSAHGKGTTGRSI